MFREALSRERVDCVFLTSPNYFGIVGELGPIIALAHERGLPVVVDAAHAPHFHFCEAMPRGAEDLGADLVTQSTHKVASALAQGSLLLVGNETFIEPLYEHVNELGLVSTSFSYPILASVELGIRQLVEEGETLWSTALNARRCSGVPVATCRMSRVSVASTQDKPGFQDMDATRVTLDVSRTGLTGFEVERQLNRERIYPEMATVQHVLFLVTPGTTDCDLQFAYQALKRICEQSRHTAGVDDTTASSAAGDGGDPASGEVLAETCGVARRRNRKGVGGNSGNVSARSTRPRRWRGRVRRDHRLPALHEGQRSRAQGCFGPIV